MMTEKLAGLSSLKKTVPPAEAERVANRELVKAARARGEDHRGGPGGLLSRPVARYGRQDLMLVRAIAMLLTRRRDVRDVEEPIPNSGPLVIMLSKEPRSQKSAERFANEATQAPPPPTPI